MELLFELKDVSEVAQLKDHLLKRARSVGITDIQMNSHFINDRLLGTQAASSLGVCKKAIDDLFQRKKKEMMNVVAASAQKDGLTDYEFMVRNNKRNVSFVFGIRHNSETEVVLRCINFYNTVDPAVFRGNGNNDHVLIVEDIQIDDSDDAESCTPMDGASMSLKDRIFNNKDRGNNMKKAQEIIALSKAKIRNDTKAAADMKSITSVTVPPSSQF